MDISEMKEFEDLERELEALKRRVSTLEGWVQWKTQVDMEKEARERTYGAQ